MKTLSILVLITTISMSILAKDELSLQAKMIENEGKMLYYSEKASWHGTDLFLAQRTDQNNIGGYVSYSYLDSVRCIFVTKGINEVIFTATFDKSFDLKKVNISHTKRLLTSEENSYLKIRNKAIEAVQSDSIFSYYNNTSLNFIPIINGATKRVYVLTAPQRHGVVLFGNDYQIDFDTSDKITSIKKLHKGLIDIKYDSTANEQQTVVATMHSHLPEMGEWITATDICTLLLYQGYAKWEKHFVISDNYVSIWDGKENHLEIITREEFNKMYPLEDE